MISDLIEPRVAVGVSAKSDVRFAAIDSVEAIDGLGDDAIGDMYDCHFRFLSFLWARLSRLTPTL